jgi:hypothetical protein
MCIVMPCWASCYDSVCCSSFILRFMTGRKASMAIAGDYRLSLTFSEQYRMNSLPASHIDDPVIDALHEVGCPSVLQK